jgi:hypothetical protein
MLGVPGAPATRRRGVGEELPFADGEAFAGVFAGEQEGGPGGELGSYPRLVEPGRSYVSGFIADFDADHAKAAFAEGAGLRAEYLYRDSCGLSGLKVTQLADTQIAVPPRDVEEQVADGADARFRGCFSSFGPHALQRAQALVEDAGAGPVDGGVEQVAPLELEGAGEGARYWAARSHQ